MALTLSGHWLIEAEHIPSPNCNERPEQPIDLLVVHCISLPPGQFGGPCISDLFTNRLDTFSHPYFEQLAGLQVSAHLLIRRNGDFIQYVPFNRRAWHAGASCFEGRENCNDFSIGIELEGTEEQAYETIQYRRLAEAAQLLMQAYPAIDANRIVGHSDIAPGRKHDPGPAFNWDYFHRLLQGTSTED